MCTKEEAKEAVLEVLYDHDDNGETIIGREINAHITNKGNQIITLLTVRFAWAFGILICSVLASWYALYYQVQNNTSDIHDLTSEIDTTGLYTQSDATKRDIEVQRQFAEQNEKILQLRDDMNRAVNDTKSSIQRIESILLSR